MSSTGCLCASVRACVYVCVRMIALVTQAISHSHCSKLWVGEGHCGADRGDREERGDGGRAAEKETEGDDNEKLKAARKWDVGLHSRAAAFRCKCASPRGLELFLPLWGESCSFLRAGRRPLSLKSQEQHKSEPRDGKKAHLCWNANSRSTIITGYRFIYYEECLLKELNELHVFIIATYGSLLTFLGGLCYFPFKVAISNIIPPLDDVVLSCMCTPTNTARPQRALNTPLASADDVTWPPLFCGQFQVTK